MIDTRQIIDYAFEEDAKGVREAMYASLHDRIMDSIEAKKQEVGANLVGGMPLATEEVDINAEASEILDEEEKQEGHEDAAQDKKMMTGIATKVAKKEVKGHETRMHKGQMEKEGY